MSSTEYLTGPDGVQILFQPTGADSWFLSESSNPNSDPRLHKGGSIKKVIVTDPATNAIKADNWSKGRLSIYTKGGYQLPPGQCKMSFEASLNNGYASRPDDWGTIGVEFTAYWKLTKATPADNELILKGPTGDHPGNSSPCCMGFSYGSRLGLEVDSEFFKEIWHVNYDGKALTEINNAQLQKVVKGGWIGDKFIFLRNQGPDKKFVRLLHYVSPDGSKVGNWVKVNETVDNGGWNSKGTVCKGDDDQIMNWAGPRMLLRADYTNTDLEVKLFSAIQITDQPATPGSSGTGGGPPGTLPQAQKYRRLWDVLYNNSVFIGNACQPIGGGGGGGTPTYELLCDIAWDGSNHDELKSGNERLAMYANKSASRFVNRYIDEVEWYLKKAGSPPSAAVTSYVERGTDKVQVYSLAYTGGTLLSTDLTTSYVYYKFTNNTHSYKFQKGDKLVISYTGGGDGSNNVSVAEDESGPFDGSNTCEIYGTTSSWGTVRTGQDYAVKVRARV